jgi:hypothetical protein
MKKYELYGGDVELTFNEGKHTYEVNGVKIPSVTGITKVIDKSGALMWWAVTCCLDYVEQNLDRIADMDEVELKQFWHDAQRSHFRASKDATDIGTLVHEWIEQWLAGKEPEMPKNEKMLSSIESWLAWADTNEILAYETEFKVYSREHDYAGTCDFDGIVNGERCIVDWKTGKAVYPEHRLQTLAYLDAREEELDVSYDARWVVVLPKDGGEIAAERIGREHNHIDRDGFLGALSLQRALKAKRK